MNIIDDDLANLTDDWGQYPAWSHRCLIRRARHRWVLVTPLMKRWAVVAGPLDHPGAADDVWLYGDPRHAFIAASEWSGVGEPQGWGYHPRTRRQRFRPPER